MIRKSVPTTLIFSLNRNRSSGFTLIEILVVITIMSMITLYAIPKAMLAFKMNIDKSSRELATAIRATYDEAILKGQIYRLVFDIDHDQYWAEVGQKDFLMQTIEQAAAEERKNERRTEEEKAKHKSIFSLAQMAGRGKVQLPKGTHFIDVVTSHSKEPQKVGFAYVYIFPHGFIEKAFIHIHDDYERQVTLVINSVTGKSNLYQRYVKEKE